MSTLANVILLTTKYPQRHLIRTELYVHHSSVFNIPIRLGLQQKDRTFLQSWGNSRETELWGFILTCMLQMDPEKRFSAEQCLEVGSYTVFRSCQKTTGKMELTPPESFEHDQPVHPIVTAAEVVKPEHYNRMASQVSNDRGCGRGRGVERPRATIKPQEPAKDGVTAEPAAWTSEEWEQLERQWAFQKAHEANQRDETSDDEEEEDDDTVTGADIHDTAAAAVQHYRTVFGTTLMEWMKSKGILPDEK